jgi:hypothetical protein
MLKVSKIERKRTTISYKAKGYFKDRFYILEGDVLAL